MKTFGLCAALTSLVFAASAFAQKSSIEGNAADPNGQPLKNGQVQIQQENAKAAPVIVKTDAKGHFVAQGLPAGNYTVAVLVGGKPNGAAMRVKANANQVARLNVGGKQATTASAATQPKKRARWIHSQTGTHMGGHFEDEPDRSPHGNVDGMSGAALNRIQNTPYRSPGASGQ